MIPYRCARCGGELEPLGDGRKSICLYCNAVMVLPELNPETFNHATELRRQCQFDQAEYAFERIVSEYPEDSESYWNLLLCRYGIEYVRDSDGSLVPTCHRLSEQSLMDDPDYRKAMDNGDIFSRRMYSQEAEKIERIRKRAIQIARTQPPCDVFISYKETGPDGRRTEDSVIAQSIYDALKEKHGDLNIFLSRVTLKETAAGLEYEPVVFSALNTAKVMILVATDRENLESTWVRNEWSRYRKMMDADRGRKMTIVYKDMDPARDFPPELRLLSVQAAEAVGYYIHDLVTGIEELLGIRETIQESEPRNPRTAAQHQVDGLMEEAEAAMAENRMEEARTLLNQVLTLQADNAAAWWGLFRIETKRLTYIDRTVYFTLNDEAKRARSMAMRYGSEEEKKQFEEAYTRYEENWDRAREAYREEEERRQEQWQREWELRRAKERVEEAKARVKKDIDNVFAWTSNGLLFEEYGKYGPGSQHIRQLQEKAEPEDRKRLEEFLKKYEDNYQAYCRLQALEATDPLKTIRESASGQALARKLADAGAARAEAEKKLDPGRPSRIVLAVLVTVMALFCGCESDLAESLLPLTVHLVPMLVSWAVCAALIRKKGGGRILLTSICLYFAIEFVIFLMAREHIPDLGIGAVLAGAVYLSLPVMVIGFFVLVVVNFGLAVMFVVGGIVVFAAAYGLAEHNEISVKVLLLLRQPLFGVLAGAAFAAAAVQFVRHARDCSASAVYEGKKAAAKKAEAELDRFLEEELAVLRRPYQGRVAECYLRDLYPPKKEEADRSE